MNKQLRVLLVADEGADCSALRAVPLLETVAYSEPTTALTQGADEQFDALLLDGSILIASDQLVSRVATVNPRLPVIVIARTDEQEDLALEALAQGADDYLMESELSPVSVCGAIRNARRCRKAMAQRDAARHQLAQYSDAGVPEHFCQRLSASLGVIEAFASTMDRQLDGHPAAGMANAMLDELHRLQGVVADVSDGRKVRDRSLVMCREQHSLGELAQRILDRNEGRALNVEAGAQWDTEGLFDMDLSARAIGNIVNYLQMGVSQTETSLVVDEIIPRIGIRQDELTADQRDDLESTLAIPAGEPGFERTVAIGLLDAQQIALEFDETHVWFDIPMSTAELIHRWCGSRQEASLTSVTPVTLYEVAVDCGPFGCDESAGTDGGWVPSYIQQAVTSSDLVLSMGPGRWLMALASNATDSARRVRHLVATAGVLDRETSWETEAIATYHLPLERDQLETRMGSLVNSRRVLLLDASPTPVSPLGRRLVEAGYDVVAWDDRQGLREASRATAIVSEGDSLEAFEGGAGLPNIPVFLVGAMKDQQRMMQNNVRFITQANDGEAGAYDELIDALEREVEAPTPYGLFGRDLSGEVGMTPLNSD